MNFILPRPCGERVGVRGYHCRITSKFAEPSTLDYSQVTTIFTPAMTSMIPSKTLSTGLLNFVAPSVDPMNPPESTATDQKAI
jgi:hypothetical protein